MIKKILCFALFILSFPVLATATTCPIALNYDIRIDKIYTQFNQKGSTIAINRQGQIRYNDYQVQLTPAQQLQAKALQHQVRLQLLQFKIGLNQHLNQIHSGLQAAIKKQLGNDSRLLGYLDRFYSKLVGLMQETIYEQEGTLYFNHEAFNQLTAKGQQLGKVYLATIIADSVIHFKLIKNYQGVHRIADSEWKAQKPKLKAFEDNSCAFFQAIDAQYQQLYKEIIHRAKG